MQIQSNKGSDELLKSMIPDEKFRMMTETPVQRLICSLAIPTIISMLITSIYNMADTFFVSRIGTSATGAVGVSFSLMAIIQAIGFTFGTGAGNCISRLLGQKKRQYAGQVLATSFFTTLLLGAILAFLGLLFLEPLVYALGATETIAPYAKDYLRYILIGMPYMAASFVLNNTLRFQGSAFYGMLGIGAGALINIALDPLFIFTFDMGIGGAALATIISQFISFLILLRNTGSGGNLRVRFKSFTPRLEVYKQIFRAGLPSFYRQALASTAMISLNFAAAPYGDAAVAALSIVARVSQFALSMVLGLGQGFQPVCGFNYGAQLYDRVSQAFWFVVKVTTIFLTVLSIIGFSFAPKIMTLFRKEDLEVVAIGTMALRLHSMTLPLTGWIIAANFFLQTIGQSIQASVVAVSRQGLFYLPAIHLLPRWLGLFGVELSNTLSDVLSFAVALWLSIGAMKKLNPQQLEGPGQLKPIKTSAN